MRKESDHQRSDEYAYCRQDSRHFHHRPDFRPRGVQSTVEQNRNQGKRTGQLRDKGVVKIKEPPQQHPQADKQNQGRHTDPVGKFRGHHSGHHQHPDQQNDRVRFCNRFHFAVTSIIHYNLQMQKQKTSGFKAGSPLSTTTPDGSDYNWSNRKFRIGYFCQPAKSKCHHSSGYTVNPSPAINSRSSSRRSRCSAVPPG